ncbi:hypothetical protein D3C87_1535660 [compost metagenome]
MRRIQLNRLSLLQQHGTCVPRSERRARVRLAGHQYRSLDMQGPRDVAAGNFPGQFDQARLFVIGNRDACQTSAQHGAWA